MSVKALAGQLSCDFTQDNTQLLQLSLVGRRILDTSFYSKTTADCSKNVMLHDIKHSQMAQMSLYNSFFQDSVRLPTNVPDQRPLSFPKLALSQNLNGEINYFNKFNSLIQQQPVFQRIQGTSDYSSFPTVEKHNNNDNNKLCLLSDETLSFHNELSSPAKTPVFCKLEDADNCKDNKELPSPTDTKETNENSPLVSDSKQPKITKNILFYKTHFLITSNPNLPKLDLPESEDMIPKIKHDGITKSGIRFEENSTNQNRLRSQIKSLNLFINYSEISTDRSEDSLNLFCEESYNLDDILLKNDSEENVQACTKEERLAKILKYKNKIRKWRSNHPVNKRFNGRSSVATKKPRIKGKFVTSEKYLEFLELQSPNEQTPCQ